LGRDRHRTECQNRTIVPSSRRSRRPRPPRLALGFRPAWTLRLSQPCNQRPTPPAYGLHSLAQTAPIAPLYNGARASGAPIPHIQTAGGKRCQGAQRGEEEATLAAAIRKHRGSTPPSRAVTSVRGLRRRAPRSRGTATPRSAAFPFPGNASGGCIDYIVPITLL
jgi:hypothetical protein